MSQRRAPHASLDGVLSDVDVGKGQLHLSDFNPTGGELGSEGEDVVPSGNEISGYDMSTDTHEGSSRRSIDGVHGDGDEDDDDDDEEESSDGDESGELNAVYLKRNADFHMLFRELPINELLIDDYGCALQRDILVQGRLYLTENHVCFYSNIFGWVTNLIIALDEIVLVEKRMTALIIPNAIEISTLHAKHFFGSFIYRDSAYSQLTDLWRKARLVTPKGDDASMIEGDVAIHTHSDNEEDNYYQTMSEEESDVSLHKEQGMDGIHTIKGRKQVGGDDGSEPGSGTDSETESKHDLPINDAGMAAHQQHPYAGGAKNRSWKDIGNASAPRSRRSSNAGTSVMSVDTAASAAVTNGSGGNLKTLATPTSQQKSSLSAKQVAPLAQQLSDTDRSEQNVATGKPRAASAIITTTVGKAAEVKPADGQDKGSGKHKATARKEEEEEEEETKPLPLHPPTQCPCDIQGHAHYENTALDEVFPVSMPVLFRLVFSEVIVPPDVDAKHGVTDPELIKQLSGWMRALLEKQGMRELKIKPWSLPSKPNESESQEYNYIRPLNFSIGPKQTNVTQTFAITTKDFERAVVVEGTVKTPDVPSGSSFYVKTRSCLSWAAGANGTPPGGCTRLRVTFKIEWTKSSWIKGAVEKGTIEGNKTTYSSLKTELLKWIEEHPQLTVRSTVEKRPHRRPKSPEERRASRSLTSTGKDQQKIAAATAAAAAAAVATAPAEVAETGELARRRRRYTPFIKEKPEVESPKELVEVGRRAAENEAEEEADRQGLLEATRSWNGWLRYHVIRPFSRLGLGYTKRKILGEGDIREVGGEAAVVVGQQSLASLTIASVVSALVALLVVTNSWRFAGMASNTGTGYHEMMLRMMTGGEGRDGGGAAPVVQVLGMDQMQEVMDRLAQQLDHISQYLRDLESRLDSMGHHHSGP